MCKNQLNLSDDLRTLTIGDSISLELKKGHPGSTHLRAFTELKQLRLLRISEDYKTKPAVRLSVDNYLPIDIGLIYVRLPKMSCEWVKNSEQRVRTLEMWKIKPEYEEEFQSLANRQYLLQTLHLPTGCYLVMSYVGVFVDDGDYCRIGSPRQVGVFPMTHRYDDL